MDADGTGGRKAAKDRPRPPRKAAGRPAAHCERGDRIGDLYGRLPRPAADFRGAPFWAWNARLDPGEVRRQVRVFRDMGLGGFFMHARTGLATPYLGQEWFDCVRAAVDEAKKAGLHPWMYDEDRWPSGVAGGLVTRNPRYRERSLACEAVPRAEAARAARRRRTLAWFAETPEGAEAGAAESDLLAAWRDEGRPPRPLRSYRRLASPGEPLREGEVAVRYFAKTGERLPRYNGETYLDTLNPAAVRAFVRTTHEAYRRELGEDFGGAVPGCFTDEPRFPAQPWTDAFPAKFHRAFGYDLLDRLPELFRIIGGADYSRVRHDYISCAATLFLDAFPGTIGRWCRRHGLIFTGHALAEDALSWQSGTAGSCMRFHEHQQGPGIDVLSEHSSVYATAKQCSSVARQQGRPYRVAEAYGCTGWDFPLEGHKAIGDWLAALGINHRCQHLAWYSMAGEAKRDFPASISRQSPWFQKYAAVEDYFARIGETLATGKGEIPLLVVHPVESAWGYHLPGRVPAGLRRLDRRFVALVADLLANHLDFDFGDEDHLARFGAPSGKRIRVGKAAYEAVLVPALETIRPTTLALLSDFASRGGRVFYLGRPPARVGAQPSEAARAAFAHFTRLSERDFPAALAPAVRRVSVAEDGAECRGVLYQERRCRDGVALFACNASVEPPRTLPRQQGMPRVRDRSLEYPRAEISIRAPRRTGDVYEIDLSSGRVGPVPFRHERGCYRIAAPFARLQSRCFLVTTSAPPAALRPAPAAPRLADVPLPPVFSYALDEPNALLLDAAAWSVDGGAAHPETRLLAIDQALRATLGAPPRLWKMAQPWAAGDRAPARRLRLRLAFTFGCSHRPAGPVCLAVERPGLYRAAINGRPVAPGDAGWWVDPCLRRLPLPADAIREGANELILETGYDETQQGLEPLFLLGPFGVSPDGRAIVALPGALRLGDVCGQGLPNYSGNLACRFRFAAPAEGAVRLSIGRWAGVALGFRLNGGAEVLRAFPPYEAVFADGLRRDGTDEMEVVVYGHRRNAFGPFYVKGGEKWPYWAGPAQLSATDEPERALVPFGLLP